jgi:hypothetical protein
MTPKGVVDTLTNLINFLHTSRSCATPPADM